MNLTGNYSDSIAFSEDKNYMVVLPQADRALLDSEVREIGEISLSTVRRLAESTGGDIFVPSHLKSSSPFKPLQVTYQPASRNLVIHGAAESNASGLSRSPAMLYAFGYPVIIHAPTISYNSQIDPEPALGCKSEDIQVFLDGVSTPVRPQNSSSSKTFDIVYLSLKFQEARASMVDTHGSAIADSKHIGTWVDSELLDAQLGSPSSNRLKAVCTFRTYRVGADEIAAGMLTQPFSSIPFFANGQALSANTPDLEKEYHIPLSLLVRDNAGQYAILDLLESFGKRGTALNAISSTITSGAKSPHVTAHDLLVKSVTSPNYLDELLLSPTGEFGLGSTASMDASNKDRVAYIGMDFSSAYRYITQASSLDSSRGIGSGLTMDAFSTGAITPRAMHPFSTFTLDSLVYPGARTQASGYIVSPLNNDVLDPKFAQKDKEHPYSDYVKTGFLVYPFSHTYKQMFAGQFASDTAASYLGTADSMSPAIVTTHGAYAALPYTTGWVNSAVTRLKLGFRTDSASWASEGHFGSSRAQYSYSDRSTVGKALIYGVTPGSTTNDILASSYTDRYMDHTGSLHNVLRLDPMAMAGGVPVSYGQVQGWDTAVSTLLNTNRTAQKPSGEISMELRSGGVRARGLSSVGAPIVQWSKGMAASWLNSSSLTDHSAVSSEVSPVSQGMFGTLFGPDSSAKNWELTTTPFQAVSPLNPSAKGSFHGFGVDSEGGITPAVLYSTYMRSHHLFISSSVRVPSLVLEDGGIPGSPFWLGHNNAESYDSLSPIVPASINGRLSLTFKNESDALIGASRLAHLRAKGYTPATDSPSITYATVLNQTSGPSVLRGMIASDVIADKFQSVGGSDLAYPSFVSATAGNGNGYSFVSSPGGYSLRNHVTGDIVYGLASLTSLRNAAGDILSGQSSLSNAYKSVDGILLQETRQDTAVSSGIFSQGNTPYFLVQQEVYSAAFRKAALSSSHRVISPRFFDGLSSSQPDGEISSSILRGSYNLADRQEHLLAGGLPSTYEYTSKSIQSIFARLHASNFSLDSTGILFTSGTFDNSDTFQGLNSSGQTAKVTYDSGFKFYRNLNTGSGYSWVLGDIHAGGLFANDLINLDSVATWDTTSQGLAKVGVNLSGTGFSKAAAVYSPIDSNGYIRYGAQVVNSFAKLAADSLMVQEAVAGAYSDIDADSFQNGITFYDAAKEGAYDAANFARNGYKSARVVSSGGLTSFFSKSVDGNPYTAGAPASGQAVKWRPGSVEAFEVLSGGVVIGQDFAGLTRPSKADRYRFGSDGMAHLALSSRPISSGPNSGTFGSLRISAVDYSVLAQDEKDNWFKYGLPVYRAWSHNGASKSVLGFDSSVVLEAKSLVAQNLNAGYSVSFYDPTVLNTIGTDGNSLSSGETLKVPFLSPEAFPALGRVFESSIGAGTPAGWTPGLWSRFKDASNGAFQLTSSGSYANPSYSTLRLKNLVSDEVYSTHMTVKNLEVPYEVVYKLGFGTSGSEDGVKSTIDRSNPGNNWIDPYNVDVRVLAEGDMPSIRYESSTVSKTTWENYWGADVNGGGFILEAGALKRDSLGNIVNGSTPRKASLWADSGIFDGYVSGDAFITATSHQDYTSPVLSSYGLGFGSDPEDAWQHLRYIKAPNGKHMNLHIPQVKSTIKFGGVDTNGKWNDNDAALEIWGAALESVDYSPSGDAYTPYVYGEYSALRYMDYSTGQVRETNPLVFDKKKINVYGSVMANSLIDAPVVTTRRLELGHGALITTKDFTREVNDGKFTCATMAGVNMYNSGFLTREITVDLNTAESYTKIPLDLLGVGKLDGCYLLNISMGLSIGSMDVNDEYKPTALDQNASVGYNGFVYDPNTGPTETNKASTCSIINYGLITNHSRIACSSIINVETIDGINTWTASPLDASVLKKSNLVRIDVTPEETAAMGAWCSSWALQVSGAFQGLVYSKNSLLTSSVDSKGSVLRASIGASLSPTNHGVWAELFPYMQDGKVHFAIKSAVGLASVAGEFGSTTSEGFITDDTVLRAIIRFNIVPMGIPFQSEHGTNGAPMTSFLPAPAYYKA